MPEYFKLLIFTFWTFVKLIWILPRWWSCVAFFCFTIKMLGHRTTSSTCPLWIINLSHFRQFRLLLHRKWLEHPSEQQFWTFKPIKLFIKNENEQNKNEDEEEDEDEDEKEIEEKKSKLWRLIETICNYRGYNQIYLNDESDV